MGNVQKISGLSLLGLSLVSAGCQQDFGLALEKRASMIGSAQQLLNAPAAPAVAALPGGVSGPSGDLGASREPQKPAVCDPLSAHASAGLSSDHGLRGSLRYLSGTLPSNETAVYYRTHGTAVPVDIFVGGLNVPTRSFSTGFPTSSGEYLRDLNGQILLEHFGLSFDTEIGLNDSDPEGLYQFAILADDGALMTSMADPQNPQVLVDDDGAHATKLAVSKEAVALAHGERLPVRYEYFQGPRYEIALVVMWRKVADASDASLAEPLNGTSGGGNFFNADHSGTANYAALLARGWKVISPTNFYLQNSVVNPCGAGPAASPTASH